MFWNAHILNLNNIILSSPIYRGVAGDVHWDDQQHAQVGQDVPTDVQNAGMVPAEQNQFLYSCVIYFYYVYAKVLPVKHLSDQVAANKPDKYECKRQNLHDHHPLIYNAN